MSLKPRTHSVQPTIDRSATFGVADPDDFGPFYNVGVPDGCYLYGRQKHEAGVRLGQRLAGMEGGEAGYVTASGLSAINVIFLEYAKSFDQIVVSRSLYGGTRDACHFWRDHAGIRFIPVDITDLAAVKRACADRSTKMLLVEGESNPDLVVAPIAELARITKERGIPLVVDNTFTPIHLRPIMLGADIVVHSLTKYVSGDSQAIAGGIVGPQELITKMMHMKTGALTMYGSVLDPGVAQRLLLHMDHLSLRVDESLRRMRKLVSIAKASGVLVHATNTSGVFSVVFPSYATGAIFVRAMIGAPFVEIAVSLGASHTYIVPFGSPQEHAPVWDNPLPFAPIPQGLVRIAVGYAGDIDELAEWFARALKRAGYPSCG